MAKGKKVRMFLQRTGRRILGRMWSQVGDEAYFPSSVPPLPHGRGGKGFGARSWTSSPSTPGIPEHVGIPSSAQAHCMWSCHSKPCDLLPVSCSTGTWTATFLCVIHTRTAWYSQCLSQKTGMSEGKSDNLWIPTKFTSFILLYFMSYPLLFSLHHFIFHLQTCFMLNSAPHASASAS